jgi:hypothetical protein
MYRSYVLMDVMSLIESIEVWSQLNVYVLKRIKTKPGGSQAEFIAIRVPRPQCLNVIPDQAAVYN